MRYIFREIQSNFRSEYITNDKLDVGNEQWLSVIDQLNYNLDTDISILFSLSAFRQTT